MTGVFLALMLLIAPLQTIEAAWRPDTQAARLWLKGSMPKRQFRCLDTLWSNESGWQVRAGSYRKAYGIPQAFPGNKMRAYGKDWRTNAMTQVRWGRNYIRHRYGTPCAALRFQNRHNYY